jgi:hypothetical protein
MTKERHCDTTDPGTTRQHGEATKEISNLRDLGLLKALASFATAGRISPEIQLSLKRDTSNSFFSLNCFWA